MCFYYQLSAKAQDIENRYQRDFSKATVFEVKDRFNAFENPKMPVIIKNESVIQFYNWGLIPHWAKDDRIKMHTLNARIESLSEKPATGFYEWHWLDAKGKQKQQYLIKNKELPIFSFAGLYAIWVDPNSGKRVNSFTIITTQANSLMSKIHNTKQRMPIILRKEDEKKWLNGSNYMDFAYPYKTALFARKYN
jgi:putative SOS response-associated peptidase YedK